MSHRVIGSFHAEVLMYIKTLKRGRRGFGVQRQFVSESQTSESRTESYIMALRHFCYLLKQRKFACHLVTAVMMPVLVRIVFPVKNKTRFSIKCLISCVCVVWFLNDKGPKLFISLLGK